MTFFSANENENNNRENISQQPENEAPNEEVKFEVEVPETKEDIQEVEEEAQCKDNKTRKGMFSICSNKPCPTLIRAYTLRASPL